MIFGYEWRGRRGARRLPAGTTRARAGAALPAELTAAGPARGVRPGCSAYSRRVVGGGGEAPAANGSASPAAATARSFSTCARTNSVIYLESVMFFTAATTLALRTRSASTLTFMHRPLDIGPPGNARVAGPRS